jgi:AcrR family transcriptional regulator
MRKGPRVRRGSAPGLLIDAARELFAERGYHSATTREIAKRAGVSEDLIFRYFESKSGLLSESVLRPVLESIDGLRVEWMGNNDLRDKPTANLIHRFVASLHGLVENNRVLGQAIVQIFTESPDDPLFDELRDRLIAIIEPMVAATDDFLNARSLRRTDPGLQLRLMMILTMSAALYVPSTYPTDGQPSADAVLDEITALIVDGLGAASERSTARKP